LRRRRAEVREVAWLADELWLVRQLGGNGADRSETEAIWRTILAASEKNSEQE
jgi:hypothetical protein